MRSEIYVLYLTLPTAKARGFTTLFNKRKADKRYTRLTWSLPPHLPVNMCFLVFFTGLTSKPRHAHEL